MNRRPPLRALTGWPAAIASGAAALAATSAFDREPVRLVLALAAVALLAAPHLPRRWRLSAALQTRLLAALAVAAVVHGAGPELLRWSTTPWIRVWNVYHYYLGAEYFHELGFYDLYDATLRADKEGADYWRRIDRVRNLRTYRVEVRSAGQARFDPAATFAPERWERFKLDVAALQTQMPPGSWEGVFRDRGYNPSPFWTAVGRALTAVLPAESLPAMKLLTALDLLLLVLTFAALHRTFGLRAAALALLFLALSPVNIGRLAGGFLQYDWFCAIALGLCSGRRGRQVAGAAFLAYAALARVFPAIFVVSALVPATADWVARGRSRSGNLRFFAAFGIFCLVGLGVGGLGGRGLGAWGEFVANLRHHSDEHVYGQRRVGLQHVFTRDVTSLDFDVDIGERREWLDRQWPLYLGTAALFLSLWCPAVLRRRRRDALLLGLVPFFVLAVASRYYWACLALVPLLARPGPDGRRRGAALDLAQAAVYAGYFLFVLQDPQRYAAYAVFNLLLAAYLVLMLVLYLRRDVRVLRRWRRDAGTGRQRATADARPA